MNVNVEPLGNGVEQLPAHDDRPVMVDVSHVSMVFNMANQQLNSLKEYAIALAKRELMFKEFRALDDVSFSVRKGDVFGILGTNGSGKSTMLKIIAGVLEPSGGSCTIDGNIAPLIELGAGFDMELTARENVYLNGALLGYSRKFIDQHFDEIVEFAEVEKFLDMPMKNYSSGMVARIAFAIATVIVPDILIVDEVLSVGDFMFQQKCERRITKLIKEHDVTVLIVSHNNDQIERLCNRAIWIEKGHTRMIGDAKSVCRAYRILGGHRGSSVSERRVFNLLESDKVANPLQYAAVYGDDRYGTAAKLMEGRPLGRDGVVVLAQGDSVAAAAAATSIAGLYGAPLLLVKPQGVPDITARALHELSPQRIIVVGEKGLKAERVSSELACVCPESAIEMLCQPDALSLASCVLRYGAEHASGAGWGGVAVAVEKGFVGNLLTALPLLYSQKAPLLLFDETGESVSQAATLLSGTAVREVMYLADGSRKDDDAVRRAFGNVELRIFDADGPYNNNELVNNWLMDAADVGRSEGAHALVASVWNPYDALVAGVRAAQCGSMLMLEDPQDLDSVSHAVCYLEKHREAISALTFLGDEDVFGDLDKELLAKALV